MAVELCLKNATILALVQWSEGRTAGVRFLGRLERQVLKTLEERNDTDALLLGCLVGLVFNDVVLQAHDL
jgi:hypothetical protein